MMLTYQMTSHSSLISRLPRTIYSIPYIMPLPILIILCVPCNDPLIQHHSTPTYSLSRNAISASRARCWCHQYALVTGSVFPRSSTPVGLSPAPIAACTRCPLVPITPPFLYGGSRRGWALVSTGISSSGPTIGANPRWAGYDMRRERGGRGQWR